MKYGRRSLPALFAIAACACGAPDQRLEQSLANVGVPCFDPIRFEPEPEPAGEIEADKVRFVVTPFHQAERQRRLVERLRGYLEEEVGLPVEASVAASYADAVELLRTGEVDMAQLPPFGCVMAQEKMERPVFLATAIAQGTTTYASYLVVRQDSELRDLDDARGKRLAFVDPWSSSGFLYPRALLVRRGFDPEKDFDVRFAGQHDRALAMLLEGEVDLAAIASDTLVQHRVLGLSGPVRILAKAGRIPYDCVVARGELGPKLHYRLKNALLRLSILTPRGRAVLADYNLINGFRPMPKDLYDEVARVAAVSKDAPRPDPSEIPSAEENLAHERLTARHAEPTRAETDSSSEAKPEPKPKAKATATAKAKAKAKPKPSPKASPSPTPEPKPKASPKPKPKASPSPASTSDGDEGAP